MIKVGIIGGAGYTAGELLRILLYHPQVEIVYLQSKSHSGQAVTVVHRDLLGETDLLFSDKVHFEVDALFLCSGHGKSKEFFAQYQVPDSVKVIDLSTDYRLSDNSHSFIYGLPEANGENIKQTNRLANPGCFATSIELAFLPLAAQNKLQGELHVTAITSSTGAGQQPTQTSHFSWKNNNVAVYKPFEHQHLAEIKQTLNIDTESAPAMNFIPVRGNFSRGIMAICYTESDLSLEEAKSLYQNFYQEAPFVHLSDVNPDVKQVVNTNKCVLYLEKHQGKLMIISVIDNLLKGASGQAVQNMNLMFGIPEPTGLQLKPVAF